MDRLQTVCSRILKRRYLFYYMFYLISYLKKKPVRLILKVLNRVVQACLNMCSFHPFYVIAPNKKLFNYNNFLWHYILVLFCLKLNWEKNNVCINNLSRDPPCALYIRSKINVQTCFEGLLAVFKLVQNL